MTPTPSTGKTIVPPASGVDRAPETATKLLMRIAFAAEETQRNTWWIALPIKIAFVVVGTLIVGGVLAGLFSGVMQIFDRR